MTKQIKQQSNIPDTEVTCGVCGKPYSSAYPKCPSCFDVSEVPSTSGTTARSGARPMKVRR